MSETKKLFIDCDPGTDDLAAILAALSLPRLEVVGLASVAGNLPIDITTRNLGQILGLARRTDIPYAMGAAAPLVRAPVTAEGVHGASGLGKVTLPVPQAAPVAAGAAAFLYEMAQKYPGSLCVAAIGPLTNLARAFLAYPSLSFLLREIVLMGGGHAFGNVTPKAEFNIFADPHAAHIVFESGVPLSMIGLDATMALPLSPRQCRDFCPDTAAGEAVYSITQTTRAYSRSHGLGDVACLHDLAAMAYLVHPEAFETMECRVDIELEGSITLGQTVCDIGHVSGKPKNATVALGVKSEAYLAAMKEALAGI